jgi:hypothetical protein
MNPMLKMITISSQTLAEARVVSRIPIVPRVKTYPSHTKISARQQLKCEYDRCCRLAKSVLKLPIVDCIIYD